MPDISIRKAKDNKEDIDSIISLNKQMARETEDKTLDHNKIGSGVRAVIKDSDKGFYLIAKYDAKYVGTTLVTYEWSDWRNAYYWWIHGVYISQNYRRKGIYTNIYNRIKELAKNKNVAGIRLHAKKDNKSAHKTYKNLGMYQTSHKTFEEMLN